GALHAHVHAPDAQIHRFAGRLLGRHGGGERGRLLGALEPGLARRSPGEGVPLHIRDRDERVVERRRDVGHAFGLHHLLGALRALDLVVPLDHLAQPRDLRVAQVTNARIRIDAGLRENLLRVSRADAVDVREGVQNFLVAWQVDARYACHGVLSLPLLVLGTALADDADDPPPLDHLAMLADRFDAGVYLHIACSSEKSLYVTTFRHVL